MQSRVTFGLVIALGSVGVWSASLSVSGSPAPTPTRSVRSSCRSRSTAWPEAPEARQTPVTDEEVNAYIKACPRRELPQGLVDPQVSIPAGRPALGRATVDLDALRAAQRERRRGHAHSRDAASVPVEAIGVLRTGQGVGAFTLESVTVGGIVPCRSRCCRSWSPTTRAATTPPQGLNLEAPFRLPAKIREIRTARGQAVIVQ